MFGFGPATRIYVALGATDMRKGFNGLYGLVRDRLECDPTSGHAFLFTNARRNRLKLVVYDGSGLWVCSQERSVLSLALPSAKVCHCMFAGASAPPHSRGFTWSIT